MGDYQHERWEVLRVLRQMAEVGFWERPVRRQGRVAVVWIARICDVV